VIALLYLVPISWSAARWGQGPGIAAAITAGLAFNFFFIPPYYTFYIGSLEGWLILAIFMLVAVIIVARIQSVLALAQAREREAVFMYELSAALAGSKSDDNVARILASHIQQLYQAALVQVTIQPEQRRQIVMPACRRIKPPRSRIAFFPSSPDPLVGEICIWKGKSLDPSDDRLLQNFANQGSALERARLAQIRAPVEGDLVIG
jgi:two-component system sensor histidine kinase KdpD